MGRVCDKSGQVLCDEIEVRKRWREYFALLLQGEEVQQNVHRSARGEEEQVDLRSLRTCILRMEHHY